MHTSDLPGLQAGQYAREYPEQAGMQAVGQARGAPGGEVQETVAGLTGQRDGGFGVGLIGVMG